MRKIMAVLAMVLGLMFNTFGQGGNVTGRVTDLKDGTPIPGVTIRVKGGGAITTTALDGTFMLPLKQGKATVEFTSIGFITKSIAVNAGSPVAVQLEIDSKALSEIVVTGTGVATSKRKLGIAVESITADKLPAVSNASIDQALVGKIPGAQISSVSGNPGDPVNIVLRGINSLGGTSPLILVDGVQVSGVDLNSLDLNNIDRVEVVQGAASSAIYGAQGANGVVQVFTKKGKRGNTRVDFSSSYSSNEFLNIGGVQKSKLHPYLSDATGNILDNATKLPVVLNEDGTMPRISYRFGAPHLGAGASARLAILGPNNINNQTYDANLKFYDHFGQVFQSGATINNNLSVSGASEKSDFNFAVSNSITESPIVKNGKLNRSNLSLNVGTEIFKGLKLRSTTQLVYTKNTTKPFLGAPGGLGFGRGNNTSVFNIGGGTGVYGFLNTSPFFDLNYKQADGTPPNYMNAVFLSVNTGNPFYNKYYSDGLNNKIEIVQGLNLNYQVNKWVELDAKYGINYRNDNVRWTLANQSLNESTSSYDTYIAVYAPNSNGEIVNYQYTNTYQNFLGSATIKADLQRDFHINLPIKSSTLIAYDYRKNIYKEYSTYGTEIPLDPPININTSKVRDVARDYTEPFTTYGYLLDQKFEIGDWAGVTGGFRTDYSSNFGDGLKFTFPHFNGYVALSNLNFWKNSKLANSISYFKLRGAYGEAGIQPYFGARYPGIDNLNIGNQSAYSLQTSLRNTKIKVERTKELEFGADLTINLGKGKWFSAINGSVTYWQRKSIDVIANASLPPSTGGTEISDNLIDLSSKGVQASLNMPVYKSRDFNWDFTVNFGRARSIIDKINGTVQAFTAAAGSVQLKLIEGQPIGQIFGYKALTDVNQLRADGKTPFIAPEDRNKFAIVEGRVVDTALRAIFFSDEASLIGDPNPKFNMSFINAFSFKELITFAFQFDWVSGSHLYNQTKEWMYRDGIHGDFDKPVTINGVTAAYTAYHGSAYYGLGATPSGPGNNATKDYFYENASFLRLRNISIGFDIAKAARIKSFRKLQLVFSGRNILTSTKYTGFDPEINSGPANSSFERGIDHSSLPNIKSYQIGLNVGL
jgi:TonB-dependent starch-binding outer membrane protein SusC